MAKAAAKEIIVPKSIMSIHKPINRTPKNVDSLEAMDRSTDKMVFGQFINIECPGQPAKISGKYYKGMEYFTRVFTDNERCAIPLSVARFINERCFHDSHGYILDENGQQIKNPQPKFRYKFMVERDAA